MTITGDRFLEGVKRRNTLTENDTLLDDDDLLALCDDIIRAYIVPMLVSVRGEYLVSVVEESTVAGQAAYDFPARAVGLTLRDLKLKKSEGDVRSLAEIPVELEQKHRSSASGEPFGYYFRNDQIIIVNAPSSSSWVFEIWHEQHPSRLVKLEAAAKVSAINDDTVTVLNVPSALAIAAEVDFIRGKPGHRIIGMDKAISNINGTDITFATGAVPASLAPGDYISLAGTTPVLQIPDLLHPVLETIVSKRAMYSGGDFEALNVLSEDEKAEIKNALLVLEPRNRGEPKKIVNTGLLRGRRGPKRRGYYG